MVSTEPHRKGPPLLSMRSDRNPCTWAVLANHASRILFKIAFLASGSRSAAWPWF